MMPSVDLGAEFLAEVLNIRHNQNRFAQMAITDYYFPGDCFYCRG